LDNSRNPVWHTILLWGTLLGGAIVFLAGLWNARMFALDWYFALLAAIVVGVGWRMSWRVPRARVEITLADVLLFYIALVYGAAPAILVAALEALCSAYLVSRRPVLIAWRAALALLPLQAFCLVVSYSYGLNPLARVQASPVPLSLYAQALTVAACAHYIVRSITSALGDAAECQTSIFATWRDFYLKDVVTSSGSVIVAGCLAWATYCYGTPRIVLFLQAGIVVLWIYRAQRRMRHLDGHTARLASAHAADVAHYIDRLHASEEHFRSVFDDTAIGMAIIGMDGVCQRVNPALCLFLGYTAKQLQACNYQTLTFPDDVPGDLQLLTRLLDGELNTGQREKRYRHRFGQILWAIDSISLVRDGGGQPVHFIFQTQDITARRRAEESLQMLSMMDELTGLYNERGFAAIAEQQAREARTRHTSLMVVYADLDGMKHINDTYGHSEGDRALQETAAILRKSFRASDVIARLHGDEYIVLAVNSQGEHLAARAEARLEAHVAQFNARKSVPFTLAISVGVARFEPSENFRIQDLMNAADSAMYENKRGKKSGRGGAVRSLAESPRLVAESLSAPPASSLPNTSSTVVPIRRTDDRSL